MNNLLFSMIILMTISFIIIIYRYLTRNHNYWSSRGVKGPRPIPGFGTIIYCMLLKRSRIEQKWIKSYGKVYGAYDGNNPVLRITNPELVKQILVRDFHIFPNRSQNQNKSIFDDDILPFLSGDDWKRVRSVVGPTFTSAKMRQMYPLVRQCLKQFMRVLEVLSNEGKEIDMKKLYTKYTMDISAASAFAIQTDLYSDDNNIFYVNTIKATTPNHIQFFINLILPRFILNCLPNIPLISKDVKDFFDNIVRDIIVKRKNSNKTFNDFIGLLLKVEKNEDNVRDVNDINVTHKVNEGLNALNTLKACLESEEELEIERKTLSGVEKYMRENEIVSNSFMFLLTASEASEIPLSHCTQELALNAKVQEKLYSEISSSVDSNGEIDYNSLIKLPYLDAVVSEALRLHPPLVNVNRIAGEDYKLGDTGIVISKGIKVEFPTLGIHHCDEYFENPFLFIPERFLPENSDKILPYSYIPFGGGPRNCIGIRLGLLLIKLALFHIIKEYRIVKSNHTDDPVCVAGSVILNSPKRVIVKMIKRA